MIQRIQSLYLLIVVILSFLVLKLTIDPSYDIKLNSLAKKYYVFYFIPLIGIFTLFLYSRRTIQSKMCFVLLGLNILVLIPYCFKIYDGNSSSINLVLITCSMIECILLFVARKAIIKDENLVRSIDRIR